MEHGANRGAAMGLGECRMKTKTEDGSSTCRSSFVRPPSAHPHSHSAETGIGQHRPDD